MKEKGSERLLFVHCSSWQIFHSVLLVDKADVVIRPMPFTVVNETSKYLTY